MDDVPIVHHLVYGGRRLAARQAHHQTVADEAVHPIIVDPQVQPIVDQAGRGAPRRQGAQFGTLEADQLLAPGIAATNEVGDPVTIGAA
jgi:hypothetical protein